nr:hypothetical protein [Streptomyces sp. SID5910]
MACAVLATAALGLCGTGTAAAAGSTPPPAPTALTSTQLAAGRAAADNSATRKVLSDFFAHAPRDGGPAAKADSPAGEAAPVRLVGDSVTVYALNPDFVRGEAGAPVARSNYVATKAVSATGQTASVWSEPAAGGWKVINIASGSDETDYAALAHGNGTVFREPQINAWYVLRGDRVLPLNAEAKATVGVDGASVAAYHQHVHTAYADKLPGSSYAKKGYAGGFGSAAADAAQKHTAAGATTSAATSDRTDGHTTAGVLAGAALLTGLGGLFVRRRLTRR